MVMGGGFIGLNKNIKFLLYQNIPEYPPALLGG